MIFSNKKAVDICNFQLASAMCVVRPGSAEGGQPRPKPSPCPEFVSFKSRLFKFMCKGKKQARSNECASAFLGTILSLCWWRVKSPLLNFKFIKRETRKIMGNLRRNRNCYFLPSNSFSHGGENYCRGSCYLFFSLNTTTFFFPRQPLIAEKTHRKKCLSKNIAAFISVLNK